MSLKVRLERIEATVADSLPDAADEAYKAFWLALVEIAYSDDDEALRGAKIAALGQRPAATTDSQRAFESALLKAYGEASL